MIKKIVMFVFITSLFSVTPYRVTAEEVSKELCNGLGIMAGHFNASKRNKIPAFQTKYDTLKTMYDASSENEQNHAYFSKLEKLVNQTVDYVYDSEVDLPDGVVEQTVFMKCLSGFVEVN